jgi:hypothetical protein
MSEIGKAIGGQHLQDFVSVREVAAELELNPQTVKHWLKTRRVPRVTWGRDRRGWVFVHLESVRLLRAYRDSIKIK